jgi:hypothetical protein
MLVSTHPFALFDYFRVPYRVEPALPRSLLARLGDGGNGVYWPARSEGLGGRRELWRLGDVNVFATVVDDDVLRTRARQLGGAWETIAELADLDGRPGGYVRRDAKGSLLLPFDPGDAMSSLWSESYGRESVTSRARAKVLARSGYYLVRPLLPRRVQLGMRRRFARIQARARFPRWPIESSLHDLYEMLFDWIAEALGAPLPCIDVWPEGKRWTFVLTHDVEHLDGYGSMGTLQELERDRGYRSAWYLVPERDYRVADATVERLRADGFEIGVHGLHHDGRDLDARVLPKRLQSIRGWADRWRATGFRAPALHRDWEAMPTLGFDYDSSSFDTDPYEPQSGGCCSWLPFFNDGLVELPLTVTMDHTVFEILCADAGVWREKVDYLRGRGGMAMILTHPDYMHAESRLDAYSGLLDRYAEDETVWRALPGEVSEWWRERAASRIEVDPVTGVARVVGPAAGRASVAFVGRGLPAAAPAAVA